MPSMNILAEIRTAIQSLEKINDALNEQELDQLDYKNKIPQMIKIAMLKGYIEDKEILNYWKEKGHFIKASSLRYNIRKILFSNFVTSRSQLIRRFKQSK
jgi:hypothetical protein